MRYFTTFIYMFFLIGCSNANQNITSADAPNPAVLKCIDDGYDLRPVKQNSIVIRYICINSKNDKECKAWEYYRGECTLK